MSDHRIVAVEWPVNPWPTGRLLLATLFGFLACFSLAAYFLPALWPHVDRRFFGAWAIVAAVTAAGFVIATLWTRSQWRNQILRIQGQLETSHSICTAVEQYLHIYSVYDLAGSRTRKRLQWEAFRNHMERSSFQPPRTVIESRVSRRLHLSDDVPHHFLEPEEIPILDSEQTLSVVTILVIAAVGAASLIGLWPLVVSLFTGPAFVILIIAAVALATRIRRVLIAAGRGVGRPLALIASPGVLDDQRGRRWVSDEATMFICTRGGRGPLSMVVVGPAGQVSLSVDGAATSEFRALWQRWNHPHPRPELSL